MPRVTDIDEWVSPLAAHDWPTEPAPPPTSDPVMSTGDQREKLGWPHLKNLKKALNLGNGYFSYNVYYNWYKEITEPLGEKHDNGIDITMMRVKEGPVGLQQTCQVADCRRWSQQSDLQDFITMLKSHAFERSTTTYLLVQDMTLAMLDFLYVELRISPAFIAAHCFGHPNAQKEGISTFLVSKMQLYEQLSAPEIREKEIKPELSQYEFSAFCSKRMIWQNDTSGFHLDWKQLAMQTDTAARTEISAMRATRFYLVDSWIAMSNKIGLSTSRESNVSETSDRYNNKWREEVTIGNRIYRPHQTIFTDPRGNVESADERASWISTECYGHKIGKRDLIPLGTEQPLLKRSGESHRLV
ncbi:hypothetical protein ABW21_db0203578 [Orbilia brochopaga]|nr:hypothetical protein ABW21_db0203578 [Drechslerella brochopaga]